MIFHQHHCIFVMIPKCASTSIMKSFGLDWNHPDAHLLNDASADDYRPTLPTYFRFSTVRNPFDRFISAWKYCNFTKHRSLVDVVKNLPHQIQPTCTPDVDCEDFAYHHLVPPQHARLFDRNKQLAVNFLMRFENLQEDFDRVCDLIGRPRSVLNHENHTARLPYQAYFDDGPEARELVERLFRADLDAFGYHY